jgi:hypothetical protein
MANEDTSTEGVRRDQQPRRTHWRPEPPRSSPYSHLTVQVQQRMIL